MSTTPQHHLRNIIVIGAGGVASYLFPVLVKTFRPEFITIFDRDKLEKRNLDRQHFSPKMIGENKAAALVDMHRDLCVDFDVEVTVIPDWFSTSTVIPSDQEVDAIICVADNHRARRDALLCADTLKIPCFIGGNEYLDSEAYVYLPEWKGTIRDPRVRYPEITTSTAGSPISCTGDALESTPQLALANLSCAAQLLRLMWTWLIWPRIGGSENMSKIFQLSKDSTLAYEHSATGFSSWSVSNDMSVKPTK